MRGYKMKDIYDGEIVVEVDGKSVDITFDPNDYYSKTMFLDHQKLDELISALQKFRSEL